MSSRSIAPLRPYAVPATAALLCSLVLKCGIAVVDLWVLREFGTVNTDLPGISASGVLAVSAPMLERGLRYAGIADIALFFIAALLLVLLFRRAYRNIMQPVIANRRYSPGWTVAAFCIPGVNLVMPYLVLREMFKCSRTLVRTHVDGHWEDERTPGILITWWLITLAAFFVLDIAPRLSLPIPVLATPSVSSSTHLAGVLLYVIACMAALRLIWWLTDMHWRMRVHAARMERLQATDATINAVSLLDRSPA